MDKKYISVNTERSKSSRNLNIRLTDEEINIIKHNASVSGKTITRFIIDRATFSEGDVNNENFKPRLEKNKGSSAGSICDNCPCGMCSRIKAILK